MTVNPQATLQSAIDRFVEAFNINDLDRVMTHFAEDAVYMPGDGSAHRGRAQIRSAFEPQFAGAYGTMRFDEHDRLLDPAQRKAAIRWVCRHDLAGSRPAGVWIGLQNLFARLILGRTFGWEGIDVFHFDAEGRIIGKFTYANYLRPRVRPELGIVLTPKRP